MYKNLLVIWLTLAMASAAFGEYTLIHSFEGSMGDWYVDPAAGTAVIQSTYGVTEGSYALAIVLNPDLGGNNFHWTLRNDNMWQYYGDPPTGILAIPGISISLDITWVASEWYDDMDTGSSMWASQQLLVVNSSPGWGQFAPVDTANPSYPGTWDPYNWGAVHTRRLRYNMSNYDMAGANGAGWMQFIFSTNWDGEGIVTPGTIYIDNIRFIPEPATIALLGLGALALLRRKR